ncbi:hypothetical protein ACHAXA_000478 [Cyclostephanos tholiformis]|jgi:hypothetical protein|uniref:Uncharacterized protein n=1 Tax=Cyclostephanos tholiformis TaxID=382380 RepID=A0ABD3REJ9_9STRA
MFEIVEKIDRKKNSLTITRQRQGPTASAQTLRSPRPDDSDDDLEDGKDDEMKSILGENVRISPTTAIATWYMNQMNSHELRTKFISSGVLAVVGDVCAQAAGHYMSVEPAKDVISLDRQRMIAMFVDGLICTGPLLHYVYEMYEWILPTHGDSEDGQADKSPSRERKKLLAALAHVLFDNFVMCIVYITVLMIATGIMEGKMCFIPHELRHDLIPAVKVSWKVSAMGYAPMQFLSFHFLPRKLRVLAVNSLDVVWVTVMSYVTHRNRH